MTFILCSKGKNAQTAKKKNEFRNKIIEELMHMLREVNPYVEVFRMAKDRIETNGAEPFHMRIINSMLILRMFIPSERSCKSIKLV